MFKTVEVPQWALALAAALSVAVTAGTGAVGFAVGRYTAPTSGAASATGAKPGQGVGKRAGSSTDRKKTAKPGRSQYAHLIGAGADAIRAELGAPDRIESDPVESAGDPFDPKPVRVRTVRWVYDGPPRVVILVTDGRAVAVD